MTAIKGEKMRRAMALCVLALVVLPYIGVADSLGDRLIGVWKLTSAVDKVLSSGQIVKRMGEIPTGIATFSRKGATPKNGDAQW